MCIILWSIGLTSFSFSLRNFGFDTMTPRAERFFYSIYYFYLMLLVTFRCNGGFYRKAVSPSFCITLLSRQWHESVWQSTQTTMDISPIGRNVPVASRCVLSPAPVLLCTSLSWRRFFLVLCWCLQSPQRGHWARDRKRRPPSLWHPKMVNSCSMGGVYFDFFAPWLTSPHRFVKISTLDFVGTNAYWLPALNSDQDIDLTLGNMSAAGIKVVRTWAFNGVFSALVSTLTSVPLLNDIQM